MIDRARSWLGHLKRPGVRRVVENTGWLLGDRVFRLGVGFLVGVWVARYLGPDRFGLLNYALAFVSLLGTAVTVGTDNIVVRDLVNEPDRATEILHTASLIRIAGTVGITLLVAVLALTLSFQSPQTPALILLFALALVFRPFDVVDLWFQSQTRTASVILARNASFLLVSAVKLALVAGGASVVAFAACEPFGAMLSGIFLLLAYWREGRGFSLREASRKEGGRLLRDSWPLLVAGMAIMVYSRIDQVMLESMLGPAGAQSVGLYSAALRLSEMWYFIPLAVATSVFPKIVESKRAGEEIYYARLQRLFSLMTVIALAVAIPMSFLAPFVIDLIFGARFAGAGPILAIHVWTTLFVFWGVVGESWYLNEGLTRMSLVRTVVAALLNVALNLVLIPRHGGVGAAAATLVSQACVGWIFNLATARTRPLFLLQVRSLGLRGLLT
jgi:PST family polysaccharide transporter